MGVYTENVTEINGPVLKALDKIEERINVFERKIDSILCIVQSSDDTKSSESEFVSCKNNMYTKDEIHDIINKKVDKINEIMERDKKHLNYLLSQIDWQIDRKKDK